MSKNFFGKEAGAPSRLGQCFFELNFQSKQKCVFVTKSIKIKQKEFPKNHQKVKQTLAQSGAIKQNHIKTIGALWKTFELIAKPRQLSQTFPLIMEVTAYSKYI